MMILLYSLWNIAVFFLVFIDKRRARRGQWRISERTFFLCALLFGALGVLIGMYVFRHKTRHAKFVFGIPLLLLANAACFQYLLR